MRKEFGKEREIFLLLKVSTKYDAIQTIFFKKFHSFCELTLSDQRSRVASPASPGYRTKLPGTTRQKGVVGWGGSYYLLKLMLRRAFLLRYK